MLRFAAHPVHAYQKPIRIRYRDRKTDPIPRSCARLSRACENQVRCFLQALSFVATRRNNAEERVTWQAAVGMPISIPDDRAVSGVGLKPTLEFRLLRSEVLAARGYPEVDGDARRFTRPFMYDFIGRSNQTLQGSTETPKNRNTACGVEISMFFITILSCATFRATV